MKRLCALLLVSALARDFWTTAALEADIRLHCLSLRIQPATTRLAGQDYRIEITTDAPTEPSNGELTPAPEDLPYSHGGSIRLRIPDLEQPLFFPYLLDVPSGQDENNNFLNDFFEVDLPVIATSSGVYNDGVFGNSPLAATWTRTAGEKTGNCRLQLPRLGLTFNAAFELLQFDGKLRYTVQGSNVSGTAKLTQRGNDANFFAGPMSFIQINTNRLLLSDGNWTNALGQTLAYFPTDQLTRDGRNYSDFFEFLDGDLNSTLPDYDLWVVIITDPNDSDGDGVPDLSDAAAAVRPSLKLERAPGQVLLNISGETGRSYVVENTDSLNLPNWTTALTVSLTNSTQSIQLPIPAGPVGFWRVRLP